MAIIIEDGTGKADAEAFISVADADSYFALIGETTAWGAASEADKEKALRRGAMYMAQKFDARWLGTRTDSLQSLSWPRYDVVDLDGYVVNSDIVPVEVGRANAELASRHIGGTELLPDLDETGTIRETMVKVGPITDQTIYQSPKSPVPVFSSVNAMLSRYMNRSGSLRRA